MPIMFLTQNDSFILGPIAKVLGVLINYIFEFLNFIGIPNIGLAIILFTIVIYMLMLPLTVKQQKFSKMSSVMNPEIKMIQDKYKGKQDQASMLKQQDEIKAVYAKYGVSPSGSCLPLLVQMPILFALYRVIYAIPAYVTRVKDIFTELVTNILSNQKAVEFIQSTDSAKQFAKQSFEESNTIIDVLNRFSTAEWISLAEKFPELGETIETTQASLNQYNNFLGLNIAETPWDMLKVAFAAGAILMIIGAIVIPVLSGLTQWLSVKISMSAQPKNDTSSGNGDMAESMASSMKMMNNLMPLISVYFCFVLPAGMGLYWIASAVVRMIQQLFVNRKINKMDIEAEIKKNIEKYNAKRAKQGLPAQKLSTTIVKEAKPADDPAAKEERQAKQKKASEYYNQGNAKPGSLAAKARMVQQYNEKNKK